MAQYRVLLDAFAETRRTWDDLVALQPDVLAASGTLTTADLDELGRRVNAHREAMDMLCDALSPEPPDAALHHASPPTSPWIAPED